MPIGPRETVEHVSKLLENLSALPQTCEVILALGDQRADFQTPEILSGFPVVLSHEGEGRAQQMNAGAKLAKGDWLWFLHVDSGFEQSVLEKLIQLSGEDKEALYFHELRFADDGPSVMKLNERMVSWRSNFLGMPFGDQGFFLKRALFEKLGGYREDVAYGEDHVFVWAARQEGYDLISTRTDLTTSARKYRDSGWLRITARHVWLTYKQAFPEFLKLLRMRLIGGER